MERFDVVIIGAGASGLACARECGLRGRSVAVLDHAAVSARKVRISGGGRCNVTNMGASASDYVCANPHFVKSALARHPPGDVLAFLAGHGVDTVEEDNGRVFCVQGAEAVAQALLRAAGEAGARLHLGRSVAGVERSDQGFTIRAEGGVLACKSLVAASGGLAWPQLGATNFGHALARSMGLKVTPLRPALAPMQASPALRPFCASLSGVSLPVRIFGPWGEATGDLLFTHKGVSGPAVLDASLFWRPGLPLALDLLPGVALAEVFAERPRRDVRNALATLMPRRPAAALCERHGWGGPVAAMSAKALRAMEDLLHAWPLGPTGTAGYDKAEVTLGGVDTDALSSRTMEAKAVPGLFFTGEVLDVTGRLGGFNLQWAWSSGHAAGHAAGQAVGPA